MIIFQDTKITATFSKEAGIAWAVDLFNKKKDGTINAGEEIILEEFEDMFDFWHINLEDEARKVLEKSVPF